MLFVLLALGFAPFAAGGAVAAMRSARKREWRRVVLFSLALLFEGLLVLALYNESLFWKGIDRQPAFSLQETFGTWGLGDYRVTLGPDGTFTDTNGNSGWWMVSPEMNDALSVNGEDWPFFRWRGELRLLRADDAGWDPDSWQFGSGLRRFDQP